jgi:hypothetical protein
MRRNCSFLKLEQAYVGVVQSCDGVTMAQRRKNRPEMPVETELNGVDVLRIWAHLPPGRRGVSRSLLAERILKAAKEGERDPARLRALAIAGGISRRYRSPRSGPRCGP